MQFTTMALELQGKVAVLTLRRPEKFNTMNRAFWQEMVDAFAEIAGIAEARAVVIRSTGRHFTAGLDLNDFGGDLVHDGVEPSRRVEQLRATVLEMQETFNVIDRCRLPVLAAVQGGCIGGGVDLVSACDMRYCTADAFFCIQEVNIGIAADVGTLQRLPHILPQGLVRELAYTGRRMMAEEARASGLVNAVLDEAGALEAHVMGVAGEIASKSPVAVVGIKEMLNYARDHSIDDGLRYVATWNAGMLGAADLMEAMRAQQEKRAPEFEDLLPPRRIVQRR